MAVETGWAGQRKEVVVDAAKRIGATAPVIDALQAMFARRDQVIAQRFVPQKEREELQGLGSPLGDVLGAEEARVTAEAAAERDQALAAVQREEARARELPRKGEFTLSHEFLEQVAVRQLEDIRELDARMSTLIDVTLLSSIDDPSTIETIVEEAVADGNAGRIRHVDRVAQLKLSRLAVAEMARDDGQPRLAAAAAARVAERLRTWRLAADEKSPSVRRQRVEARYAQRVADARTMTNRVRQLVGLSHDATRP